MKEIVIAGVPEHFNLPWLDAIEAQDSATESVRWVAEPQGTGAMVGAIREGALDAAVLLTEGAVAAIAAGTPMRVAGTWVETPLQWGIHVPAGSDIESEAAIKGCRYAISRHGSGSHLMACAHARRHDWSARTLQFQTVGTIDGARAAFAEGRADVFFWERTMTAPLVEAGEFRRVGIFEAPWPAFVLCIADAVDAGGRERIARVFAQALTCAQRFASDFEATPVRVSETFGIERDAAREWLAQTRWAQSPECDVQMLERVGDALQRAGIIAGIPTFEPAL